MTHDQLEQENALLREVVRTLIIDVGGVMPQAVTRAHGLLNGLDHEIDRHRRDNVINALAGRPPVAQDLDRLQLTPPVKYMDYLDRVEPTDRLNIRRVRQLVSDLFRPVLFNQELGGDNKIPTELWSQIREAHHTDLGYDLRGNLSTQRPTHLGADTDRVSVFLNYRDSDHAVRVRLFDHSNRLPGHPRSEDIEITTTLNDGQIVSHRTAEVLNYNLFEAALYHAFADVGVTLNPPHYPKVSLVEAATAYLKHNRNVDNRLIIRHRQHPHLDYESTYFLSYDFDSDPEWAWRVSVDGQMNNVSQRPVTISERRFADLPLLHRRELLDGLMLDALLDGKE